jgi:hypothetical protein
VNKFAGHGTIGTSLLTYSKYQPVTYSNSTRYFYFFREIRHNVPRYFNHSIDTIAYYSEKAYVFDPATSCAGCDPMVDKVYTINILLLVCELHNSSVIP